jgi:hypothetical protein
MCECLQRVASVDASSFYPQMTQMFADKSVVTAFKQRLIAASQFTIHQRKSVFICGP